MLILGLLLSWSWNRVVNDCHGGPESTSYYYFQATIRVEAMTRCTAEQGSQTDTCLVIVPSRPIPFGPNIGDPGLGTTVVTWFDPVEYPQFLPVPPPGGLAIWPWPTADNPHPVVAVDRAGNSCAETCQ